MVGTREQQALRRQQVLDHIRDEYPELWRMSFEVDVSLLDWASELRAQERLESMRNFGRLWEIGHGAPKSR